MVIESYKTAKELRTAILHLVKPDPTRRRFNLHDELIRILSNPKKGTELNYKRYLDSINHDLYNSVFKNIPKGNKTHFTDLYTQLLVFITFMGWSKYYTTDENKKDENFSLQNIIESLPPDSLIKNLIKIDEMPKEIRNRIIKPIEGCFQGADYKSIMNDLNHVYGQFYSDFLHTYNAQLAVDKGVVYTPDEIIFFIVRSTDYFLKNREWMANDKLSNIPRGILDKKVCFLDPAAGTMSFSVILMKIARKLLEKEVLKAFKDNRLSKKDLRERTDSMFNKWIFDKSSHSLGLKEEKDQLSKNQQFLLKNVFAFEVLISPYVIGYFRMLMEAEKFGAEVHYNFHEPQIYLNNALKTDSIKNLKLRSDSDVIVIWGNPPYNISSQNSTPWIMELTDQYVKSDMLEREPGKPAIKKLSGLKAMKDDAIKFHRFAQWQIADNNRQGIVAYISNGFFLDGTVARGMRKTFRAVYDEIWVVNLFGNKEKGLPQRLRNQNISFDENVFESGCSRSIAITFMIRYPPSQHVNHKKEDPMNCKIYYVEKAGSRVGKLEWLSNIDISSLNWIEIGERLDHELTPEYTEDKVKENYGKLPYFCGIFRKNLVGIVTGQDTLVMNIDKERLIENLNRFYHGEFVGKMTDNYFVNRNKQREQGKHYKDQEITFNDNRDWKISDAMRSNPKKAIDKIVKCQWRGFDERYLAYYRPLIKRGTDQYDLMQYLLPGQGNVAMCVARKSRKADGDSSVFITSRIIEAHTIEGGSGIGDYIFPLKINVTNTSKDISDEPKPAVDSNINPNFKKMLPYNASDEEIFYYIYGILYTPKYRREFREMLKDDFPRIRFPESKESLAKIAHEGMRLVKLHLLLENDDKKSMNPSSPLYLLLSKGMNDELSLSDCTYNINANSTEDRRLRRIWFEGNIKDKKTGRLIHHQKDENGTWIPFRIFFKEPKKGRENEVFWINGVTRPIWEFEIGGRKQILEWLRVRKYSKTPKKYSITHELRHNKEELDYLRLMVSSIKKTLDIQSNLDKIYQSMENQFLEFDIDRLNELVIESR